MRVVYFCSAPSGLSVLQDLFQQKLLAGICTPLVANNFYQHLAATSQQLEVPLLAVEKHTLEAQLKAWLPSLGADVALVMTFPFKIPAPVLSLPAMGFFNVHFSLLPRYRGPEPLFWQIKNGEAQSGLSIVQMDEKLDRGPVLYQAEIPVLPMEALGRYNNRLSMASVEAVRQVLDWLADGSWRERLQPQEAAEASYYERPGLADMIIRWQQYSADEIVNLVCACNPHHGGALTMFGPVPVRILEAQAVNWDQPVHAEPGTVVVSDPQVGVAVACQDGRGVLLNVLHSDDGYVSGRLMASMFRPGDRFFTHPA